MHHILRRTGPASPIPALTNGILLRARSALYNGATSQRRNFGGTSKVLAVKPFLLADIGEGITECQVISWLVKSGDQVQEFDPICEVQSDKASVEITSRFEGTIKKLHYEPGDMAVVGSPLLDIDVDDKGESVEPQVPSPGTESSSVNGTEATTVPTNTQQQSNEIDHLSWSPSNKSELISPAVRRLLKENNVDAAEVQGTGKDQRIIKGDVLRFIETRAGGDTSQHRQESWAGAQPTSTQSAPGDRVLKLSPVQMGMFKSMTQSLSIPHFLYTHTVDLTALMSVRQRFSKSMLAVDELQNEDGTLTKLTLLPFVLKAVSKALLSFPQINSRLVTGTEGDDPQLEIKGAHHFGLAVDTPHGLMVPVVRNVQDLSVVSLMKEISRLGDLARDGKLRPGDMQGATLVVSNIGSIGGQVVAPVILSPMTAIVAVGRVEQVPAFSVDGDGKEIIIKKTQAVLSWSADHRVLDGGTVARCAQQVAFWLENMDYMGLSLK